MFRAGIVLYAGESTVPLGDRLWALAIDVFARVPTEINLARGVRLATVPAD